MKYFLSLYIMFFAFSTSAAEVKTTLDFDSLFPNISEAAQKLEARLQKMNGGKPLTPQELRNISSQLTEELTHQRNAAILQVRKYCYAEIHQFCGYYESFSDAMRTCITANRPKLSATCNEALKDNIGETLAKDTLINGLTIPQHSKLIYNAHAKIIGVISPTKTVYNGILFKSGEVRFEDDIITFGRLPRDTLLQGITFKGLDKDGILFHNNGMVKRGMLAQDTPYQGLILKAHTTIQLHPNRYFQSGVLAENFTMGERTYKAGTYLYANDAGEISDDHTILLTHTRRRTNH